MKTDNSLFCPRDIPAINNGYGVSNAVDYAKKNDVLPTILSTFSLELRSQIFDNVHFVVTSSVSYKICDDNVHFVYFRKG